MSLVVAIQTKRACSALELDLSGFTPHNYDKRIKKYHLFHCFCFSKHYSPCEFLYFSRQGTPIFIEDFPHKRAFLAEVKRNLLKKSKQAVAENYYRLNDDFVKELMATPFSLSFRVT